MSNSVTAEPTYKRGPRAGGSQVFLMGLATSFHTVSWHHALAIEYSKQKGLKSVHYNCSGIFKM